MGKLHAGHGRRKKMDENYRILEIQIGSSSLLKEFFPEFAFSPLAPPGDPTQC